MTILFEKEYNGILIRAQEGFANVELKDGIMTVYGIYESYDSFRTADIYLDEKIIQVGIAECFNGSYKYRSNYYVLDYGVYNLRRYDDMSVIKNLERIDPKIFPKKERHTIELLFGGTKKGKETLEELIHMIGKTFETTSYDTPVRIRNWNQIKELLITPKKTKATFALSTEMISEFADFIEKSGYPEEAKKIKSNRAKAVFEKVNYSIDFSQHFKKITKAKK